MNFTNNKIIINIWNYLLIGSLSAAFMNYFYSLVVVNDIRIINVLPNELVLPFITFAISILITFIYTKIMNFNSNEKHNIWEISNTYTELLFEKTSTEIIEEIGITKKRILKSFYLVLLSLNGLEYSFIILPIFLPLLSAPNFIITYYSMLILLVIPITNIKILIISHEIFGHTRIYLKDNKLIMRKTLLWLTFTSKIMISDFKNIKYEESHNNSNTTYLFKYRKQIILKTTNFDKISVFKARIEELEFKNQNQILV